MCRKLQINDQKQILRTVESMQSKTTLSTRQTWDGHAKVILGVKNG